MKSYLGVAAHVQNRRAKPGWSSPGGRCQGVAAMRRREEAGSLDQSGGHLSQNEGRVSPLRTKPSLLVPRSSRSTSNAVRWLGGMVRPALMIGKWFVSLTDEVPRGSSLGSITWTYKALPKWFSHASAAGTATPWPRSWGCLQRQSTSPSIGNRKAKPQSQFSPSVGSRDKLALAKKQSPRPTLTCNRGTHQEEDPAVLSACLPVLGAQLCPPHQGEPYAPAYGRGRPVQEICPPVQYGELTPLRQRGGGGFGLPLTHRGLFAALGRNGADGRLERRKRSGLTRERREQRQSYHDAPPRSSG